jgi:hypothetical protein
MPEIKQKNINLDGARGESRLRERALTAISLGVLAMYAKSGYAHDLPDGSDTVVTSLAHPVFGYMGAWAGVTFAKSKKLTESIPRVKEIVGFLGATACNFSAEIAQLSNNLSAPTNFYYPENLPETTKDYAFALLGATWFALRSARNNNKC